MANLILRRFREICLFQYAEEVSVNVEWLNPSVPNAPFLYPLKTKMSAVGTNRLIYSLSSFIYASYQDLICFVGTFLK